MRHRKKLIALAVFLLGPVLAHAVVGCATRISPPENIQKPTFVRTTNGDVLRTSKGWSAKRGVRLAYLSGTPEEIGAQHTVLLREGMREVEGVVWSGFARLVPFMPARTLMFDIGRVRYRNVANGFPELRIHELATEAATFDDDPYAGHLPTYQRIVLLHALYDISLSFEHSPLLGCTAFGFTGEATADGHVLFARAFDFEAAEVFDREKAVFLVHENGKIPFASVAWPGFVGVVTGMNAHGVGIAVHGGRAREPVTTGTPVAFALREVLQNAKSTAEATDVLKTLPAMVSHIVFIGDAGGKFVVVERAPGVPDHVRSSFTRSMSPTITNHFEGPLKGDPRDDRVRASTTTLARRERVDQLTNAVQPGEATPERALAILRDHGCAAGTCPLGDRRAIDPFIATHGILADLTTHTLWVSEGPRLSGRFVKVDPATLVQQRDGLLANVPSAELETLAEDPALRDGRYLEGRARAGGPILEAH